MKLRKNMVQKFVVAAFVLAMGTALSTHANASEAKYQEAASETIMNSLSTQGKRSFLRRLYKKLFFAPVWMREKGLSPAAEDLFEYIKNDKTLDQKGRIHQESVGLESDVREMYRNGGTTAQKVSLEFKISQLYEAYTNYAYMGGINWGAFNARISNLMVNDVSTEWMLHRPSANAITMAENAALGESLSRQLQKAIPNKYHYKELRRELKRYRKIKENGGWPRITISGTLKKGASSGGVKALRERLRTTGDYTSCGGSEGGNIYNACLVKAVKRFQKRNGITSDGEVGPGTLRVLNKTVNERITTLLLNLDRIKWLKNRNSRRHVIINIPDFMLYFEEDGRLKQSIKAIVGKPKNPTPIFSNTVKTIVLNPYWNLPQSIVQKEMIPKLMRNSNAMTRQGIEIKDGWGKNAKKVKASSVNWGKYRYSDKLPFKFAQVPGPKNALGKVKFLFPNKFSVYMHDTPTKKLFSRSKRAFSHGCIRLQKPRELLKTFSNFNSNINFQKSQSILKGKKETPLALMQTVPVDVIYLTSWVDYDGELQFRNDIYDYDKMQLKSFRRW